MLPLHNDFLLTAHRGAVDRAPENTLLAFQEAQRLGIAESELDVRLSADGVLVIGHDYTVENLAIGGDLVTPMSELSLEELKRLDLGLGQTVPTFEEVLNGTDILLQVEIKDRRAARPLAEFLETRPVEDQNRCMVTSFDPFALAEFQAHAPQLARGTGFLIWSLDSDWRHAAESLRVRNLLLHWPGLTRQRVRSLQDEGYRVCSSMYNSAADLRRILETGVQGSSTDRPIYAKALIESLG
ncbi:MAG: glycerophosphodiester phosphodiesterase family protein [Propionibacteriaceae bacterium]|nr:glycerophosphodiester phosphodiesterase family protein [Propionibacteriaceae bacterium]